MRLLNSPRQRWNLFVLETKYVYNQSLLLEAGLSKETTVKDALEAMDLLSMQGKKAEVMKKIFDFFSTAIEPFEEFLNEFISAAADKVDTASGGWFSKLTNKAKAAQDRKEAVEADVAKIMREVKKMTDTYKSDGMLAVLQLGEDGEDEEDGEKHPFMEIIGTIIKIFFDNKDLIFTVLKKLTGNPKIQKVIEDFINKIVDIAAPFLPGLKFAIGTAKFVIKVVGSAKEIINSLKKGPDDFFGEVIDSVGQAPDKNTKLSPFLDLFNMDDEFQVILDDQLEAEFLAEYRKNLQSEVVSNPNKPLSAFDINDALQEYLKNKYNDHTVVIQEN